MNCSVYSRIKKKLYTYLFIFIPFRLSSSLAKNFRVAQTTVRHCRLPESDINENNINILEEKKIQSITYYIVTPYGELFGIEIFPSTHNF